MTDHRVLTLDCVEGMASLSDGSIDVICTDPPYSAHVHENGRGGNDGPNGEYFTARDLGFTHLGPALRAAAAQQFARLARRWVLVFSDVESAHLWRDDLVAAGLEYVRTGIWVKPGSMPQFTGDRPAVGYESIVIAHRPGKKRWNGGGHHAVWTFDIHRSNERQHGTMKPLGLMEALIRDFTDPGEIVLDAFTGSGTTGVACRRLGRRFLGFEVNPEYAAIASKRIENAREQLGLTGIGA